MEIKQFCYLITVTIIFATNNGNCDRIKDRMYETINGARACFRRMNGTHQIGCSSKWGGSTGIIHYCNQQNDLDFILKNGTAGSYIPIIPTKLLTKTNIDLLKKQQEKINGLLVYVIELDHHDYFTHEQKCPNYQSNLPNTCSNTNNNNNNNENLPIWNPYGTGLLYEDIPFPIFYINNDQHLNNLIDCFNKFNNYSYDKQRDRPLCSLQMDAFMFGIKDTPTCRRRSNSQLNLNPIKYCDPLGDFNIWSTINFNQKQMKRNKLILLITHIDTTTMFDKTSGAISPITNIVTLLTTAKYLKQLTEKQMNYKRDLIIVMFNGETYDYMGSQRFYYDLINDKFPNNDDNKIKLDDIELIIDLNQLGSRETLTLHYLYKNPVITEFITILNKYKGDNVEINESFGTLPPSSLHTFLTNNTNLPGIVITDHNRVYTNHFYHSIYDNTTNINYYYQNITNNSIQKYIGNISQVLGDSLYYFITGNTIDNNDNRIDLQLVDELFHCYLEDANCRVHQAVQKLKLPNQPLSLYVGVERDPNFLTVLIGLTLGWLTGDVVGDGNINCTNRFKNESVKYYNMSASLDDLNTILCYRISMNFTSALSPAFIIDDYDWSSGQYSSWSESTWSDIRIRLFLKPSVAHENMTIAIGSIVLILSFLFVYFVKNRSEILFVQQLPTLAPTSC